MKNAAKTELLPFFLPHYKQLLRGQSCVAWEVLKVPCFQLRLKSSALVSRKECGMHNYSSHRHPSLAASHGIRPSRLRKGIKKFGKKMLFIFTFTATRTNSQRSFPVDAMPGWISILQQLEQRFIPGEWGEFIKIAFDWILRINPRFGRPWSIWAHGQDWRCGRKGVEFQSFVARRWLSQA